MAGFRRSGHILVYLTTLGDIHCPSSTSVFIETHNIVEDKFVNPE